MLKIFCLPQILLVFLCSVSIAQNEVKGRILDAKTGEEISYATVYIDGTSIGTISDSTGEFSLIVRSFPSKIVVRHLSYERYVYLLKEWGEFKRIYLNSRLQHVSEVQIRGANHRAQNLEIFREEILGTDKWGRNAKILNEDKISFFREELMTDTEAINNFRLIATSKEPLKIYIPLLGYLLHLDLVRFESTPKSNSRLGFYYYEPIKDLISRKKRSIEKNRKKVYQNSSLHFIRSLSDKKVEENGYVVAVLQWDNENNEAGFEQVELSPFLFETDNAIFLKGLDNKKYHVFYYENENGEFIDLSKKKRWPPFSKQSNVFFLTDSCAIRRDGTLPDNSIMFGGAMGGKQIGASLPADYFPSIKKN